MIGEKKIYDFKVDSVKQKIVNTIKKGRGECTVADLIASTGLPKYQVDNTIKLVVDEYGGRMKVTESGEILYSFPERMRSKIHGFRPAVKRAVRVLLKTTGKILAFLFKVWIMVMLVGYFILFVALLLLALFASIAASAASKDGDRSRSRGGGFGTFYLTTVIIDLFIRLWIYSSIVKIDKRRQPGKNPLYKSVFAFVFGSGNPNSDWEEREKIGVINYIRSNRGIISTEEFMALTGLPCDTAQSRINRYCIEYEGEPEVTPGGTLIFKFPELIRSAEIPVYSAGLATEKKKLIPFNNNKSSTNRWIAFFNGFNLLFSSYFLYFSFFAENIIPNSGFSSLYLFTATYLAVLTDPTLILAVGLGVVPFSFSVLFYLLPFMRRLLEKRKNEEIKKENFRKKIYQKVLDNPLGIDPEKILPAGREEAPKNWKAFREGCIKELGSLKEAEIEELDKGKYIYSFPELLREKKDIEEYRKKVDMSEYKPGKTIFDTGDPNREE
ncbi:MAG: hypothetical protein DRP87_06910 [Spirochaetes bacterium]|nr:MAG: hypothetical protein DRP87_06910 [Spirochaetota bacterium]